MRHSGSILATAKSAGFQVEPPGTVYVQCVKPDSLQLQLMTQASRPIPRDGRLVSLILASKGVQDADERVLLQLLDFAHRYTADVLLSSQTLVDHANRPGLSKIEKEDVALAIQMRRRNEFFEAPPRDYLASLAHELNVHPLPILSETFDVIRLPPAYQRLAEVDFDLLPGENLVDEDSEDSENTEDEDEVHTDEDVAMKGDDHVDPDEDDLEEVGIEAAPAPRTREIDEDYDE